MGGRGSLVISPVTIPGYPGQAQQNVELQLNLYISLGYLRDRLLFPRSTLYPGLVIALEGIS